MKLLIASLLLAAPAAFAQQPQMQPADQPMPFHHHEGPDGGPEAMMMHHHEHGGFELGLPPGEWWRNPELATKIALTPDQTKKLEDLSTQGKLETIKLHAALESDEVLLRPMLEGPSVDEHAAQAQIDKIADARAALEKAEAHNRLAARAVLTADQWTKLHTHEPHDRHMGPEGMHRGWNNGPMPEPGPRGNS